MAEVEEDPHYEPVLAGYAYVILVILDLVTTTILLRAFPEQARESNGLLAGVIDGYGLAGLWGVKMGAAAVLVGIYLVMRNWHRGRASRAVLDTGIVASCVVQGAIVLSNLAGFLTLIV
ncbi:MAG TPA: DUF5658 family protein [Candidatus Thermoplasmatota archaeon]|nr:DUF5658 family protein [Candidatus Thermoplasmatota archaeon]